MDSNIQHFGYFLILSVWKLEHCASNTSGIIWVLFEGVKLWRGVLASFFTCCGFWCRGWLLSKEKKTHLFSKLWQRTDSLFLISELQIWAGQTCPFSLPLPRDEWQWGKCKGTEGKCNWSQGSAACCFCSTLEIHRSIFIYFHKLRIVNTASTQHSSKNTPAGFSLESPACNFELRLFSTPFPASSFSRMPVKGLKVLNGNIFPSFCEGDSVVTPGSVQFSLFAAPYSGCRIQHLLFTFYYGLLHSELALGGVALVSPMDLYFPSIAKACSQICQRFSTGWIGCAKCKRNYSRGGGSTQIVWLFRGIITQTAFPEIVAMHRSVQMLSTAPCPPNLVHYGATTKTILSGIRGCSSPCWETMRETTVLITSSSKSTLKHS